MSELVRQSVDSLFRSQGMLNREELKQHAMDTVGTSIPALVTSRPTMIATWSGGSSSYDTSGLLLPYFC